MQFAMMPLQGLTQGAQPIISYNYGARNPERVRRAFQVLLMACLAYSLLLWALVQLFPQLFALMFTSDSELVSYASWALRIYMAGHRDLRHPDRLSADFRGPGQRQDLLVPGSAAEDHPADSLHLYSAQLFCG